MAMTDQEEDKPIRSKKDQIRKLVVLALLCIAAVSIVIWIAQSHRRNEAEEVYDTLAQQTRDSAESTENIQKQDESVNAPDGIRAAEESLPGYDPLKELEDAGIPIPDKNVDIAALKEELNPDIYAWIYIPDSQIDYPVLQHATDNSYYLNYNIDGSKGYPGCIYTENYNAKDFSDPNTVLYGHNMKNGSMFAGLHKFEDKQYFEEHPYVYVYTEDGLLVYEIFAARESDSAHILLNNDFSDGDVYRKYLKSIFEIRSMNANIRQDVSVTENDRIITLSTCISNRPNNRYLVQGVLLNEKE